MGKLLRVLKGWFYRQRWDEKKAPDMCARGFFELACIMVALPVRP